MVVIIAIGLVVVECIGKAVIFFFCFFCFPKQLGRQSTNIASKQKVFVIINETNLNILSKERITFVLAMEKL